VATFSHPRLSQISSKWDFWFENKPSGNPAPEAKANLHKDYGPVTSGLSRAICIQQQDRKKLPGPNPTTSKFTTTNVQRQRCM
jgi:hypothetical protein